MVWGGVPISALVASGRAFCFAHGDQGGTYNGNPLMSAAALAVLNAVSERAFLAHVQALGEHLRNGLNKLGDRHEYREVSAAMLPEWRTLGTATRTCCGPTWIGMGSLRRQASRFSAMANWAFGNALGKQLVER